MMYDRTGSRKHGGLKPLVPISSLADKNKTSESKAIPMFSGSSCPMKLVKIMSGSLNRLATMSASGDKCISGLAAATLDFPYRLGDAAIQPTPLNNYPGNTEKSVEIPFLPCPQAEICLWRLCSGLKDFATFGQIGRHSPRVV